MAPEFWSQKTLTNAQDASLRVLRRADAPRAADGPTIDFELPTLEGITASLGVRLGAGGWEDLAGSLDVDAQSLAKLPIQGSLPGGWKLGYVSLNLAPEARQLALEATATGPSAAGDGAITLTGALTFDGVARVSVEATNLAVLQSPDGQTTVSGSGELTLLPAVHSGTSAPVFPDVQASVNATIDGYHPAPGLTLSGEVSWSTSGPLSLSGVLTATAKGRDIKAEVTGNYTSDNDWSLYATLSSATGLRIGDLFTLETLRGTVARGGTGITIDLNGAVQDVHIPGVTVTKATAALSTTGCDFSGPLGHTVLARVSADAGDAKPVCLSVGGELSIRLPGAAIPLTVQSRVVVDLATLSFSLGGTVPEGKPFGPEAFRLHAVNVWVTNAAASARSCQEVGAGGGSGSGGVSFGFTAKGQIAGIELGRVAGAYLVDGQLCISADIGSATLPGAGGGALRPESNAPSGCTDPAAPALQKLRLSYSSKTEVAALDGQFCLPAGLRRSLGAIGQGVATVSLKVVTIGGSVGFDGDIRYTLTKPYWLIGGNADGSAPLPSKAVLALESAGLHLTVAPTVLKLSLDANGKLRMPTPADANQFGGPAALAPAEGALRLEAAATLGTNPSFRVTAKLTSSQTTNTGAPRPCTRQIAAIRDVFNQSGLDICAIGVSGTLGASPSLSAAASFTLPASWGRELGISNASYELAFNISATSPCLDFRISQIDTAKPAIDLFNKGVMTADQVHLVIAPTGCEVPSKLPGQTNTTIPAGFELSFGGKVLATPVNLFAAITRSGTAFRVNASFKVGRFGLGPVSFNQDSEVNVFADPTTSTYRFSVKTSATIGTTTVDIDAGFAASPGRVELHAPNISLRYELGLATFQGRISFDFVQEPGRTVASFTGQLNADIRILTITVTVQKLDYDSTKGGLQTLNASASASFTLGPARGTIGGSVSWQRGANALGLSLSGDVTVWGFSTKFSLPAKLSLNIDLPFSFGSDSNTTKISEPRSVLVLRLRGLLKGDVNKSGTIAVTQVMPIEACFPFETVCLRIGDARVNTTNGTVTFRAFGFDVVINASEYIRPKPGEVDYSPGAAYLANDRSGKCLDLRFANFNEGTRLWMENCKGNDAQRFRLLSDGTLRLPGDWCVDGQGTVHITRCSPITPAKLWFRDESGRLRGSDGTTTRLCLDIAGHSTEREAYAVLDKCTEDQKSQRWVMAGSLKANNGRGCLDIPTGNLNADLQVFPTCNGTQNQVFALYPNGELRIRDLCVTVAKIAFGEPLRVASCTGSQQQRWELHVGNLITGPTNDFGFTVHSQCVTSVAPVRLAGCARDNNFYWNLTF